MTEFPALRSDFASILFVLSLALILLCQTRPAFAQTRAGTAITNVAQVRGTVGDGDVTAASNAATFLVAERLDLALSRPDHVSPGGTGSAAALPALLTNRGNGSEAFALTAVASTGVTVRGIAIDRDGDGAYDPAHDTLLSDGRTPALDPGAAVALLVLVDGMAGDGVVTLDAHATTGSGTPGILFAGAGDGGSDAVVGPTGADARVDFPLAATAAAPVLLKSQSVRAPDGGAQPVRGATVTYTLQATFADARRAVRIDDPIPAGARYVPGTLTLDGVALTDAADGDAGAADGASVAVTLGDIAAPVTRTVRFQAVLQ
ncbi:MAG: hypothetical protein ACRYFW_08630 [Janthinobacterium lividum]